MNYKISLHLTSALLFLLSSISLWAQNGSPIELTEQNVAAWRDHIVPQQADLKWQQIPWLPTFKDGILASNDANKPLLLWTMNGHPLGCT